MTNEQLIVDAFKQFLQDAKYEATDDVVLEKTEWTNDIEIYIRERTNIGEMHPSCVDWDDYIANYVYIYDPADIATPTHKRYKFFAYYCIEDVYYITEFGYEGR